MSTKPKSAMAALLSGGMNLSNSMVAEVGISAREEDARSYEPRPSRDLNTSKSIEKNSLVTVDPLECCLWRFADRPEDELGDIESLAHSMKEHGQQEPILIRPNTQKTPFKYEIIFGNRRWRAAKLAGIKIEAIFKEVSDQQAALCQKEENENREKLSDYARALSYSAQIDRGVFRSEVELSHELGINPKTFNDLMSFIRIPEELRTAIPNFRNISRKMAIKLSVLSKKKENLAVLLKLANDIGNHKITSTTIDLALARNQQQTQTRPISEMLEARNQSGQVIAKLKKTANGKIQVEFSSRAVESLTLEQMREKIAKMF